MEIRSECVEWTGPLSHDGYPAVYVAGRGTKRGHRVAYEAVNGPIPDGLMVMHRCDNPRCLNPDHLTLGTARDNNLDMVAKGRHWTQRTTRFGCGHPRSSENRKIRNRQRGWVECRICRNERMREINRRARSRKSTRRTPEATHGE